MLPKTPNKYSMNTVVKYHKYMIQGDNSILTILKAA